MDLPGDAGYQVQRLFMRPGDVFSGMILYPQRALQSDAMSEFMHGYK